MVCVAVSAVSILSLLISGLGTSSSQTPGCNRTSTVDRQGCNRNVFRQVWPEVEPSSDGNTKHIFFGLMMSFGGDFRSHGAVPAVQVALKLINEDRDLLPGHTLHYTLLDSQCNRVEALDGLFTQLWQGPQKKLALLGAGCSVATEPTAEISHYYNITQISCVSSSTELANRARFKSYFQLLPSEADIAPAYFGVIQKYKWKRVALIVQNENRFTVPMVKLKELLSEADVEYVESVFESQESIAGLDQPFDPDSRVFVIAMYSIHARQLMCQASRLGRKFPRYVFLTPGWYEPDWWVPPPDEDVFHLCTPAEREAVLEHSLAVVHFDLVSDVSDEITSTGISSANFSQMYQQHLAKPPLYFPPFELAQHCYDATWALAYALNHTMEDNFNLDEFDYSKCDVLETIQSHLKQTNFTGVSGPVTFDPDGIRMTNRLRILQYRSKAVINASCEDTPVSRRYQASGGGDSCSGLELVEVATVRNDNMFVYLEGENQRTVWPDGVIPYDGVVNSEIVSVAVPSAVLFMILAGAGLVFAVVCIAFNWAFRKRKQIRLSSPNLNYLIGAGAAVFYIDVYLYVFPTTSRSAVGILCNAYVWLIVLGYSLCFGTIVAKMWRVYHIFHNPQATKKRPVYDWHLGLFVGGLVLADLLILTTYTAVEGSKGKLTASLVPSLERTVDVQGEREVMTMYSIYTCNSEARLLWLGLLFGFKALLQVFALFFAFQTRKVKVKGLDDAKYIAAAIYVSSIIIAVTMVTTYSLREYVNTYAAIYSVCLIVCSSVILGLVFVPKMVRLYKDPEGKHVFIEDKLTGGTRNTLSLHTVSSTDREIDKLRKQISELEKKIARERSPASSPPLTASPVDPDLQRGSQSPRLQLSEHSSDLPTSPSSVEATGKEKQLE